MYPAVVSLTMGLLTIAGLFLLREPRATEEKRRPAEQVPGPKEAAVPAAPAVIGQQEAGDVQESMIGRETVVFPEPEFVSDPMVGQGPEVVEEDEWLLPYEMVERLPQLAPFSVLLLGDPVSEDEEEQREFRRELFDAYRLDVAVWSDFDLSRNHATVYFADTMFLPHFHQHGYHVSAVQGLTLMQILDGTEPDDLILLSVKDEGSQALTPEWEDELAAHGIRQLRREHLRHSYVNIMRKRDGEQYEPIFERNDTEKITVSPEGLPVTVEVQSAGLSAGNLSSILIDGREWSKNHRGLNIVVLDRHGEVKLSTYVDTFATLYAEHTLFAAARQDRATNCEWATDHRLVARAFGEIEDRPNTHCLEAFQHRYLQGYRVFEADLVLTQDGHLVARHDWQPYLYEYLMQDLPEDRKGERLTREEFKSLPILKRYTPLDFEDICRLMRDHPDMYLITDTRAVESDVIRQQFTVLAETARRIDPAILDRIIPQLYHERMLEEVRAIHEFKSYVYTLYQTHATDAEVVWFAYRNGIRAVVMSEQRYTPKLVEQLQEKGIMTYLHTLNDPVVMAKYFQQGVHGFYSDRTPPQDLNKMKIQSETKREVLLDILKDYWALQYPEEVVSALLEQVERIRSVDKVDKIVSGVFKLDNLAGIKDLLATEAEFYDERT